MDLTPIKTKLQRPNLTSKHSEFLGKLLHSRNVAHLVHLNTNSYAKHKALNKYYESILDLFDDLAESHEIRKSILRRDCAWSSYVAITRVQGLRLGCPVWQSLHPDSP